MKKNVIISILIAALILPLSLIFTACKDDNEKRVINNFHTAFNSVITAYDNTVGIDISDEVGYVSTDAVVKKLGFVYSSREGTNLTDLIANENIYKFISSFYNRMLDSALVFTYIYAPRVIESAEEVDKKLSNKLYSKLDKFEKSLEVLSDNLENLENAIIMDGSHVTMGVCLTRLTNLYSSYETTIEAACDLSYALSDIYFDNILKNYSIDLRTQDFDDDVVQARAANLVKSKYYYYQLLYTDIFYRVNVKSGDIPTKIRTGEYVTTANLASLSAYSQFDYISTRTLNVKDLASSTNMESQKVEFKNNIIALYNCDELYENELEAFKKLTNEVSYYALKNTAGTLSVREQAYVNYIDNFLSNVYNVSKNVIENLILIAYP